jgi:hypothetical protein
MLEIITFFQFTNWCYLVQMHMQLSLKCTVPCSHPGALCIICLCPPPPIHILSH